MRDSRRRLGRSPAKKVEAMQLAVLEEQYLLHHGALGHSPKTISHYQDTFRLLERFMQESGHAATTSAMTTPVMNEFAMWLRTTPTRGWRGETTRTEAGIHGTMTDLRAFVRWMHEEGHIAQLPKVPVNKLPQVFIPILSAEELDTIFATKQLSLATGLELPHVVFWNVNARNAQVPATKFDGRMTLISGLSQSTFQYVVEGKRPEQLMNDVVNSERYAQIVV